MKKNLFNLAIVLTAVLTIVGFSSEANAQRRRAVRANTVSKVQVKAIVKRVEDRVDNFVNRLDKSLDRSRLNDTNREEWLMKRAKDLESATDNLSSEYDLGDSWNKNRDEVVKCLRIASDINQNMLRYRFGAATETNWVRVRNELNTLAGVYRLPRIGARTYR